MKKALKTKWPLVGNTHVIDFLEKSLMNKKVAGSYIFSGPEDLGKTTTAYFFAKNLLCSSNSGVACDNCPTCRKFNDFLDHRFGGLAHGDFHFLAREEGKKNISIDQVRRFILAMDMTSSSAHQVGVIKNAEQLSPGAASALLKTLEEPARKAVIILIVSDLDVLPATLKSRSQVVRFYPTSTDEVYDYLVSERRATRSQAKNLSRLSLGRPALAVKFFSDHDYYEEYKLQAQAFLNFFRQNINDRLDEIANLPGLNAKKFDVRAARRILSIWRGVSRDLLLCHLGQKDLLQHEIFLTEIESIAARANHSVILRINGELEKGDEYLRAAVSPKLVLENIAINLI